MRRVVHVTVLLLVLTVVNGMVVQKERMLRSGRTMLLRLVPLDPRSLMQGDYMVLRYRLANYVPGGRLASKGRLVVRLDAHDVATFVRVHQDEPLKDGEHLLVYRKGKRVRLGAEAFFFQEGHASRYSGARYGELKVAPSGDSVLVGLRNEKWQSLGDAERP